MRNEYDENSGVVQKWYWEMHEVQKWLKKSHNTFLERCNQVNSGGKGSKTGSSPKRQGPGADCNTLWVMVALMFWASTPFRPLHYRKRKKVI